MKFVNKLSTAHDPRTIFTDLTTGVEGEFDLAFLFISNLDKEEGLSLAAGLRKKLNTKQFLGCTCWGVIGTEHEIEQQPACSLILLKLPDVQITPFYLDQNQMAQLETPAQWYDFMNVYPTEKPIFFVLPDPFLLDIGQFLDGLNQSYPGCPALGGLASGANQSKKNSLILNDQVSDEGLIGVYLTGNIEVNTIVSQGCRPIGENHIVTKAQENIIFELAGKPLYEVLVATLQNAPARDRELAQEAIFVGVAMDEYKHSLKRGDFLIRMLIGLDDASGAGAVADQVQVGQTVQFHVRDSVSSTEDLTELLRAHQGKLPTTRAPQGALVFSCNGRGQNLFKIPDHDIGIIKKLVGEIPMAGFFCAGEIGPIGGKNFVHGFTSSIALFYPRS